MKAKVKKHTRVRKNGATVVRQHLRKKKKGSKRGKSGKKIGDFIQDRKVNAIIKANMNNKGPMHVKTRSHSKKKVHSKTGKPIGDSVRGSLGMPRFSPTKKQTNRPKKALGNRLSKGAGKYRSHLLEPKTKDGQHLMKTHPNYKKPSTRKKKYSSKRKRK